MPQFSILASMPQGLPTLVGFVVDRFRWALVDFLAYQPLLGYLMPKLVFLQVIIENFAHRHTSDGQPVKIFIHQLYVDNGCRLEDNVTYVLILTSPMLPSISCTFVRWKKSVSTAGVF